MDGLFLGRDRLRRDAVFFQHGFEFGMSLSVIHEFADEITDGNLSLADHGGQLGTLFTEDAILAVEVNREGTGDDHQGDQQHEHLVFKGGDLGIGIVIIERHKMIYLAAGA
jgi:hypothetical protein